MTKLIKNFYFFFVNSLDTIPINGINKNNVKAVLNNQTFSFNCTKCGKCCYGPGNVYFTNKDLINIKKYLKLKNDEFENLKEKIIYKNKNGLYIHKTSYKCYFLDEKNRCRIYPIRPLQCRTFPFWPSFFLQKKELQNLINYCPGSNLLNLKREANTYSILEIVYYCNTTIKKFNRNQDQQNKNDLIKL